FGENLTTEGLEVNDALVGERWQVGTAVLEVSEPRVPCWRLGVRMNDKMFPRRFTEALRPGPYLRIVVEGDVGAGDEIRVVERPGHDLTIRDVFRIYTRDRAVWGDLEAASLRQATTQRCSTKCHPQGRQSQGCRADSGSSHWGGNDRG